MAKKQQQLDELMTQSLLSFERLTLNKQPGRIASDIQYVTKPLIARINELADDKGKLPKNTLAELTRDTVALERGVYNVYSTSLRRQLEASAYYSAESTITAIVAVLGPGIVAKIIGLATASSLSQLAETGALASIFFATLTGLSLTEFARLIADYVMRRKSSDGKSTIDRIRIFAREVARASAQAVSQGGSAGDIIRRIDNVMRELDWRIERLVETESMTAYRTSVARLSEQEDVISAVKIIDFAEGHESTHPRHKCFQYARADEHGMGEGIYPVHTRKIRNPHPQCRSILVPVLAEDYR